MEKYFDQDPKDWSFPDFASYVLNSNDSEDFNARNAKKLFYDALYKIIMNEDSPVDHTQCARELIKSKQVHCSTDYVVDKAFRHVGNGFLAEPASLIVCYFLPQRISRNQVKNEKKSDKTVKSDKSGNSKSNIPDNAKKTVETPSELDLREREISLREREVKIRELEIK
ncbi:2096_t:CDS:2, partial [Racocetra fulgida]